MRPRGVLLPDDGHRYQSTVYDDDWLREQGVGLDGPPPEPVLVGHPSEAGPGWSWLQWGRRSYEEVVGRPRPASPALARATEAAV
jgi:cysteine synthase A